MSYRRDAHRADRLRAVVTVIIAASLSTEPQALVTRAQNCVVCISSGLVIAGPDPTGVEVLPGAPSNQATEAFGSLTAIVNGTVVPTAACWVFGCSMICGAAHALTLTTALSAELPH